jgi:hypothetical protein
MEDVAPLNHCRMEDQLNVILKQKIIVVQNGVTVEARMRIVNAKIASTTRTLM